MAALVRTLQQRFGCEEPLELCRVLFAELFPGCDGSGKARDVFAIASNAGITVRTCETELFDGKFENSSGKPIISLSTLSRHVRTRFTLAHELGHWMLRKLNTRGGPTVYRGAAKFSADAEEERFADLLAAEILMPINIVRREAQNSSISLRLVTRMAKQFAVSFKAALRRVADVSSTPFLYLNVVPNRFRDPRTFAEVDDAILVRPLRPLWSDRESTRFLRRHPFDQICATSKIALCVRGSFGRVNANFDVRANSRPIPNCDLFAVITAGNLRQEETAQPESIGPAAQLAH